MTVNTENNVHTALLRHPNIDRAIHFVWETHPDTGDTVSVRGFFGPQYQFNYQDSLSFKTFYSAPTGIFTPEKELAARMMAEHRLIRNPEKYYNKVFDNVMSSVNCIMEMKEVKEFRKFWDEAIKREFVHESSDMMSRKDQVELRYRARLSYFY